MQTEDVNIECESYKHIIHRTSPISDQRTLGEWLPTKSAATTHLASGKKLPIRSHKYSSGTRYINLVPRPFKPPVFDRLQYASTEGEGLGDLVTCDYVR